jgi:hypothetical protein
MKKPEAKQKKDSEFEELNNQLCDVMYYLKENHPEEAACALLKLEAASNDIHKLRIKHLLNGKLNGV